MKDVYGRSIDYLRISLTDRCNFRCRYCMPEEGVDMLSHRDILTFEEILAIVSVAVKRGISKVRLTGGEPLVRKGVAGLIRDLKSIDGINSISMTTNGFLLGEMAEELKERGLDRVNISLDTVNREKFLNITRRDGLDKVISGIDAAVKAGLNPVKLNSVIMRGTNDDEILNLVRFAQEKKVILRFIEQMPFGSYSREDFVSAEEIKGIITGEYGSPVKPDGDESALFAGFGPSEHSRFGEDGPVIGFITPVSNHFCGRCNRLRLTADGKLKPCLLSNEEIDLKSALRSGLSERDLESILTYAVDRKPKGHFLDSDIFESTRGMSKIGG
ncbi:GTP 3',8-cyclase MoaA [Spirochaeta isovalerica]|uniref:GTP 3',8-cyclase n=1 Tax=Spirochaeta isovalerica TaxID=150 RepID=A0A841REJ6_9SPIO|nr:GTP 3',8-cyclase MoaA [Spirochaeta isovalerica]MBB6482036.1 cyclic pyranopterin phosphate synthase [Spirochaeta isovalerica]